MEKENFINILDNAKKSQINNKYNNFFDSLSNNLNELPNIIFYGPPGCGKYSETLKLINKFSNSNLKYEKKMYIKNIKGEHIIKISDIHYEINMENLTCNSKQLFNDIYKNIIDSIETSNNKSGIILFKNFHLIEYELLDIFYSYIQKKILSNIVIKFLLLTDNISFIPNNILNVCKILYYSKFSLANYIKISNIENKKILLNKQNNNNKNNNNDETTELMQNIDNISLLKHYNLNNNTDIIHNRNSICDSLINIILKKNIDYVLIRNNLYDLLIYNQNIHESIYYIISNIIKKHKNIPETFLVNIYIKLCEFFKYYNNNYRPIFHMESLIFSIINELES